MPIELFDLNENFKLKFMISTTIDDSKLGGGPYHAILVAIWKDNGRLYVELDNGEKKSFVVDPNKNKPFFEVCVAMKQLVLNGCGDKRLD